MILPQDRWERPPPVLDTMIFAMFGLLEKSRIKFVNIMVVYT